MVIPVSMPSVQVLFAKPEAMQVRWDVTGVAQFDSTPLIVPGRQNFPQNGIYRLKVTNIAGREGVELYPTVEIGATTPRSTMLIDVVRSSPSSVSVTRISNWLVPKTLVSVVVDLELKVLSTAHPVTPWVLPAA